jgi:hypothetical protein
MWFNIIFYLRAKSLLYIFNSVFTATATIPFFICLKRETWWRLPCVCVFWIAIIKCCAWPHLWSSTISLYPAISNSHVALVMIHNITPSDIGPSLSSIFLLNYNSQIPLHFTITYSKPMHCPPKPGCLPKTFTQLSIIYRSPHFTIFTLTDAVL